MSPEERLLEHISVGHDSGCWICDLTPSQIYPVIQVKGRKMPASRLAHELWIGPIPPNHHVDHVRARGCNSKRCINPAHLEAVSVQENLRRSASGLARCGHPFDAQRMNGGRSERYCSSCKRAYWRAQYHTRREGRRK